MGVGGRGKKRGGRKSCLSILSDTGEVTGRLVEYGEWRWQQSGHQAIRRHHEWRAPRAFCDLVQ